jgi:hypothetical protein
VAVWRDGRFLSAGGREGGKNDLRERDIKAVATEDDALNFKPSYWENVYRTNTQTAYTSGKLMQFKDNPPPAWRLLIVDDDRTSDICCGLMRDLKQSLTMASDHPFWTSFGFPPCHYQCRTGLQAVYKSEIGHGTTVENPTMKSIKKQFKPMGGFGGNQLDNGNYRMMTPAMFKRELQYGIINEFNMLDNIVADFNSVWKGYKRENIGKGWIDIHDSVSNSKEFTGNYSVAKKLASGGDLVKMLPEHKGKGISGWKNPDYLINASLWELESLNGSKTSINHAIRDGQNQAPNLIIQVHEPVDRKSVLKAIFDRFTHKQYPARVRNLILFGDDKKNQWTANEIRRWEMPE